MRMRVPLPLALSVVIALASASGAAAQHPQSLGETCWRVTGGPALNVLYQTQFVPYFGKNNIHYDRFDWHIYTTEHFEIYYYPELEQHLERISGYAESAYQQVSSDLK